MLNIQKNFDWPVGPSWVVMTLTDMQHKNKAMFNSVKVNGGGKGWQNWIHFVGWEETESIWRNKNVDLSGEKKVLGDIRGKLIHPWGPDKFNWPGLSAKMYQPCGCAPYWPFVLYAACVAPCLGHILHAVWGQALPGVCPMTHRLDHTAPWAESSPQDICLTALGYTFFSPMKC